jgi:molybdate transport system ATP-binding protein
VLTFSAETHRAFLGRFAEYHQARWQSMEGEENPTVRQFLTATRKGQPLPNSTGFTLRRLEPLLGLEPLLDRQVHLLSNGESRKVFLAHLLLRSPRLLILDDPYSGLDASSRAALSAAVEALLAQHSPEILFITNRVDDLPGGVTHILGLRDGRILFSAPRGADLPADALTRLFELPAAALSSTHSLPSPALALASARYTASLPPVDGQPATLVEMSGVSVRYESQTVLDQIEWTVLQGQRWLLSGANGAGKSTLLSLILADHPQAYANPLKVFGLRRGQGDDIWTIKRRIGWVSPELHAFYARPSLDHPPFTCAQVVVSGFFDSVGLYRRPTPAQAEAASGWMEAFNLSGYTERPFSSLSNGQQRLTLLARALVKHPQLLVLDEPCQALDAEHRQAFTALVDMLCAAAPLTLIYVSHDPLEAPACITHRLHLAGGHAVSS